MKFIFLIFSSKLMYHVIFKVQLVSLVILTVREDLINVITFVLFNFFFKYKYFIGVCAITKQKMI